MCRVMKKIRHSNSSFQINRMIESPFFYYAALKDASGSIHLDEDTRRHVVTVLRMQVGTHIMLMDGQGLSADAVIEVADKKTLRVSLIEKSSFPQPIHKTILAISLLKNTSRFEWMLEKVTEIGLTDVVPLISERTEKIHFREDRMKQIIISAAIQSKQMWMPVLHAPRKFEELISESTSSRKFIAHCLGGQKKILSRQESDSLLLIGPEGDFTPGEIDMALQRSFMPVSLGESRLRTETAGVVGAVLMRI
jgi:16S rRNA (uracil1498-N3)-methyltransferase